MSITTKTYNETYNKPTNLSHSFCNMRGNIYVPFFFTNNQTPLNLWQNKILVND